MRVKLVRALRWWSAAIVAGFATPVASDSATRLAAIVFSGLEIESRSSFASSGGKLLLPLGSETSTFVLGTAGISLSDVRKHRDGKLVRDAIAADARLFLGAEKSFGKVFASLGLGPSLNSFQTRAGLPKHRAGIAAHADLWYRPTGIDVLNATAIIDTGPRSLWVRMRYGRKLVPEWPVVFGPELALSHSLTTRKYRAGLHASDIAIGGLTVSIAGGWLWDNRRPGQYLTLTGYRRY